MTMTRLKLITSVQRRRRWPMIKKERIVAASLEPAAVASEVARRAGTHTSHLFRWRKELCGPARAATSFTAVTIAPEPLAPPASRHAPVGLRQQSWHDGTSLLERQRTAFSVHHPLR
jgi:transposase